MRLAERPSRRTSLAAAGKPNPRSRLPFGIHHQLRGGLSASTGPRGSRASMRPKTNSGDAARHGRERPAPQPSLPEEASQETSGPLGKKAGPGVGPAQMGIFSTPRFPWVGLAAGGGTGSDDLPWIAVTGSEREGEQGTEGGGGLTWATGEPPNSGRRPEGRHREPQPRGEEAAPLPANLDPRPPGAKAVRARGDRRATARKSPSVAGDRGAGGGSSPPEESRSASSSHEGSSSQNLPRSPPPLREGLAQSAGAGAGAVEDGEAAARPPPGTPHWSPPESHGSPSISLKSVSISLVAHYTFDKHH